MDAIAETKNQPVLRPSLARAALTTPDAAAVAGLLFCVLLTVIFVLLRGAVPADPREPGIWLARDLRRVEIVLWSDRLCA
jgi:hypothetical protein